MFLLLCSCPFLEIIDHYFKTALNTIKYLSFKNHMVKYLESLFAFKWPAGIFLFKVYDTKEKIYYVVVTYWQIALFWILSHCNWNARNISFFVLCDQPSIFISTYQGMFNGLDGDIVHNFTMIKIFLSSVAWFWQVRDYVFPFQCLKKLSSIFLFYVLCITTNHGKVQGPHMNTNEQIVHFFWFDDSCIHYSLPKKRINMLVFFLFS